ncbi:hypothetical protein C8R45DRAFT_945547 [Mycena sanguinolenta]|nr:hypothetical protein C8R45DRAFT_945547 [Mycena sanguinolenta]
MADTSTQVPTASSPEHEMKVLLSQVTALSQLGLNISHRALDMNCEYLQRNVQACLGSGSPLHRDQGQDPAGRDRPSRCSSSYVFFFSYLSRLIFFSAETPAFYEWESPTPSDVAEKLPTNFGDQMPLYVVWVGRQPEIHASSDQAEDQVRGVPSGSRRKITGRAAALAYYQQMYEDGKVICLTQIRPTLPSALSGM